MKDEIATSVKGNMATLGTLDWRYQLAINLGLALPGVVGVFVLDSTILQLVALAWAVLNISPVIQWVLGL